MDDDLEGAARKLRPKPARMRRVKTTFILVVVEGLEV